MTVVQFLMAQTRFHNGRIPFWGDGLEEAAGLLAQIMGQKNRGGHAPHMIQRASILKSVAARGYLAMEEFLERTLPKGFSSGTEPKLEEALLRLHDAYVIYRNGDSFLPEGPGAAESERISGCIQCGECCVGKASAPLSTSPVDIELWERLGREDLLYHTEKGVWRRASGMGDDYSCCPFLRFTTPCKGMCLIHPVKPLICREFFCLVAHERGRTSATFRGRPVAIHYL